MRDSVRVPVRQPSILFVTTSLGLGGAETQLTRLAQRLKRRGWEVRVVSMLPPSAYVEVLSGAGIPCTTLHMRRKIPDPRAIFRLARIVREFRPALVHAFMVHANLLSRITRLACPMPVLICSVRNIYEGGLLREWAYRLTDPLSEVTTQVCQSGLERYVRRRIVPAHKALYIPNGLEVERFAPNAITRFQMRRQLGVEDAFVWVTVGRLEIPKDYPSLLKAFKQVVENTSQKTRLLIVGDGSLRRMLQAQAERFGIQTRVCFAGARTDVAEILQAADAFVMSSAWEGMPNALLEAAATALPIVATDVGDNRAIVLAEQSGYLVQPRNPEVLATAMLRLMALPEPERWAMGRAGREHIVANFDLERVVDQWEQLYIRLLRQKGITLSPNPTGA